MQYVNISLMTLNHNLHAYLPYECIDVPLVISVCDASIIINLQISCFSCCIK